MKKMVLILIPVVSFVINHLTGKLDFFCVDITPTCPPNTLCDMIVLLKCGFPIKFLQPAGIIWWEYLLNFLIWLIIISLASYLIYYLFKQRRFHSD